MAPRARAVEKLLCLLHSFFGKGCDTSRGKKKRSSSASSTRRLAKRRRWRIHANTHTHTTNTHAHTPQTETHTPIHPAPSPNVHRRRVDNHGAAEGRQGCRAAEARRRRRRLPRERRRLRRRRRSGGRQGRGRGRWRVETRKNAALGPSLARSIITTDAAAPAAPMAAGAAPPCRLASKARRVYAPAATAAAESNVDRTQSKKS